jgi:amidase
MLVLLNELQAIVLTFQKLHAARDAYKMEYLKHWNDTAIKTSSGKAIDLLLCPIAASASFPHDFLPYVPFFSKCDALS